MAEKPLAGKVALITGSSKGLGKAMALALAEAGASIVLVSRDREKLEAVAKEIESLGSEAAVCPADVTVEEQVKAVEAQVVERFGKLDILINNAGINVRKSVTDLTLDDWNLVMDTNVTSAFLLCHYFVPHMKGHGYGRIINMSSMMSWVSMPNRTAYSTSKTALLGLTRALALELADDGITAIGISPGPFATEMNAPLINDPEVNAKMMSRIPLKQWGKVEDVGRLAVYLCSEDARFITGTDILIDGGWTAQ